MWRAEGADYPDRDSVSAWISSLRRIPIVDPTPVFPPWVVWRTGNNRPDLAELLAYLEADFAGRQASDTWRPSWAGRGR